MRSRTLDVIVRSPSPRSVLFSHVLLKVPAKPIRDDHRGRRRAVVRRTPDEKGKIVRECYALAKAIMKSATAADGGCSPAPSTRSPPPTAPGHDMKGSG